MEVNATPAYPPASLLWERGAKGAPVITLVKREMHRPKAKVKIVHGSFGQMRLADGQNVGVNTANQLILPLQSRGIANPDAPSRISVGARLSSFTNAASLPKQKGEEKGPEWFEKPWDPPTSGLLRRGPGPSLCSALLG